MIGQARSSLQYRPARRLRSLEARKRDLNRTLSASAEDGSVEVHPNIGELDAKKGRRTPGPSDRRRDATRTQAKDIIRSLIDRVEVTAGVERVKPNVDSVGALSAI